MPKQGGCSPACFPQWSVHSGWRRGILLLCPEGGASSPLHKGMDAEVPKTASAPAGKPSLLPQIASADLTLAVTAVTFLGLGFYLEKRDSHCRQPWKLPESRVVSTGLCAEARLTTRCLGPGRVRGDPRPRLFPPWVPGASSWSFQYQGWCQ